MTGRNEACPCGSGKKFKKCHGQPGASGPAESSEQILAGARHLFSQQQHDAALASLQTSKPGPENYALAVEILIARQAAGDLDQALLLISRWQKLAKSQPEAWSRAVEIHLNRDDAAAAREALQGLMKRSPGHSRTLYYRALVEQRFGSLETAVGSYLTAARQLQPDLSEAAVKIMALLRACATAKGEFPGSSSRGQQFLARQPELLLMLRIALENWEDSVTEKKHKPADKEISIVANGWFELGTVSMMIYDSAAFSVQCLERTLHWNPLHERARVNALLAMNYAPEFSASQIYQKHLDAGQWYQQQFPQRSRTFLNSRSANRPLHVGYLSSDIRRHPVAHFILPVLQQHDHRRIQPYVYYTSQQLDDFSLQAQKSAHTFIHAWGLDDRALAARLEQDRIDILVDLNGASAGGRLSLLAARSAPVQITWLGYPNTTGLNTVDYRLTDCITDPSPAADAFCTEKLLRLPRLFSVYDPLEPAPPLSPGPAYETGHIVFGSFNNLSKINETLIACWAELLQQVPDSRLVMKDYAFDSPGPRESLLAAFQSFGIAAERISFLGLIADKREHLAAYGSIDIHLDSFPYNGTTTTCDSLLMGVPVVTLQGQDHRSRVGASLLRSAGHPEWVARDAGDYIRIARELAINPGKLQAIRSALRDELYASELMDAKSFTLELEEAYHQCWRSWCKSEGSTA
jgi:predicted O-linked N-acetylglucosamine transferase (SPINDLY family)